MIHCSSFLNGFALLAAACFRSAIHGLIFLRFISIFRYPSQSPDADESLNLE
jgi:hypothetical protein